MEVKTRAGVFSMPLHPVGMVKEDYSKGNETVDGVMISLDDLRRLLGQADHDIPISYDSILVKTSSISQVSGVEGKINAMGYPTESMESVRKPLEKEAQHRQMTLAVVDPEAIEKARAEAVAEMQEKLDKAREAKKRAEDKQKIAEEALEQARLQLEEQARAEKEKGDLARERPDPDDCRAPRLKGGPGLVSGIAWHTRVDEPEPGAEIIIIDDSGFVDSNVYIGAGDVKEPGVRWDEVALWTQMPDGPTGTPGTVVPPENGWVPLQFVKGMECPPSDGKYYCRFDCDGTVITQVAWWDGFSKSWSFKKAGAKIDAKCMGWFPLPDENL